MHRKNNTKEIYRPSTSSTGSTSIISFARIRKVGGRATLLSFRDLCRCKAFPISVGDVIIAFRSPKLGEIKRKQSCDRLPREEDRFDKPATSLLLFN